MNSPREEAFDPQQSAPAATQQLQALIPPTTRLDAAVQRLEQNGFECRQLATANAGSRISFLCLLGPDNVQSQASASAPPTPVHWTVSLDSNDGETTSRLQASRYPKDLGE